MTATATPHFTTESVVAAVKLVAAMCTAPTVITLTATPTTVTGRPEVIPGGPLTADTMPATLAGMARLITRHPAMFEGDVAGYAAVLPGERVAFAADRPGRHTTSNSPES